MVSRATFSFDTRIRNRDFPLNIKRMSPQNVTMVHRHEFTELIIIYDGKGQHITGENKPVELCGGNVLIIPKGVYHQYLDENLSLLNIIFENDLLPLPLLDIYSIPYFNMVFKGNPEIFRITEDELKEVLSLAEKLEIELAEKKPGCQFAATALFMQIVIFLARAIAGKVELAYSPHIGISRTIEYMHKHFTKKISIEELAENTGMSMSSLLRHFKRINGTSPKEYLLLLRINYACELLDTTNMSIDEIAFKAGFNDSNYFSREFRKITDRTPSKYRAERRGGSQK